MAIETAGTATGIALAGWTITITGSIFGVQYEALMAGFAGGMIYVTMFPPTTRLSVASSLAISSLLAGYFAPIAAVVLLYKWPWFAKAGEASLHIAVAAAIGLVGQSAIPLIFKKFSTKPKG